MLVQVQPNLLMVTVQVDLALLPMLVRVRNHAVLGPGSNQCHCNWKKQKHRRVQTNMSARTEYPAVNMLTTNNM